jgi:hypothetical protein
MIQILNQGWFGALLSLILFVLGYFLGNRRAKPMISLKASNELTWEGASHLPDGFSVTYLEKDIPRVAKGEIVFWNGGNEMLEGSSLVAHDRLRLEIPDGEFLFASVKQITNSASLCSIEIDSIDNKRANIGFHFLNPTDGMIAHFLHSSKQTVPNIKGTIKGHSLSIAEKRKIKQINHKLFFELFFKIASVGLVIIGVAFLGIALSFYYEFIERINIFSIGVIPRQGGVFDTSTLILSVFGTCYIFIGLISLWVMRKKYPKNLYSK